MCGIFASLTYEDTPVVPTKLHSSRLNCRGPDSQGYHSFSASKAPIGQSSRRAHCLNVYFYATVLSLRGHEICKQPVSSHDRNIVLAWNGEAWRLPQPIAYVESDESDTRIILTEIEEALGSSEMERGFEHRSSPDCVGHILADVLNRTEGAFSFVIYDFLSAATYFGRDRLGRRSLLYRNTPGVFTISSVSDAAGGWEEIEPGTIMHVALDRSNSDAVSCSSFRTSILHRMHLPPLNCSEPSLSDRSTNAQVEAVRTLSKLLHDSLSIRIGTIQKTALSAIPGSSFKHARLAVLFSGGLDCTVLAFMTHQFVNPAEPIDLLNVAFDNGKNSANSPYESCPDRLTARAGLAELQCLCPQREWRLIEIDVPYAEALEHRATIVSLMYPHGTEMDLSIAFALYFAARGLGYVTIEHNMVREHYRTSARVLISGLGADELFGGYQRHANAFNRLGFDRLCYELNLDINRLGTRNLGRDDRVISHWGKEARYPFLDDQLVNWAVALPTNLKCNFAVTQSIDGELSPAKHILRLLARDIGLIRAANEQKRAIQFGARTAKLQGKTTGTQAIA